MTDGWLNDTNVVETTPFLSREGERERERERGGREREQMRKKGREGGKKGERWRELERKRNQYECQFFKRLIFP